MTAQTRRENELICWYNEVLRLNNNKLSCFRSGCAVIQLFHSIYPNAICLWRVNFDEDATYGFEKNWKLLQQAFAKLNVHKDFNIDNLINSATTKRDLFALLWFSKQAYDQSLCRCQQETSYDPILERKKAMDMRKRYYQTRELSDDRSSNSSLGSLESINSTSTNYASQRNRFRRERNFERSLISDKERTTTMQRPIPNTIPYSTMTPTMNNPNFCGNSAPVVISPPQSTIASTNQVIVIHEGLCLSHPPHTTEATQHQQEQLTTSSTSDDNNTPATSTTALLPATPTENGELGNIEHINTTSTKQSVDATSSISGVGQQQEEKEEEGQQQVEEEGKQQEEEEGQQQVEATSVVQSAERSLSPHSIVSANNIPGVQPTTPLPSPLSDATPPTAQGCDDSVSVTNNHNQNTTSSSSNNGASSSPSQQQKEQQAEYALGMAGCCVDGVNGGALPPACPTPATPPTPLQSSCMAEWQQNTPTPPTTPPREHRTNTNSHITTPPGTPPRGAPTATLPTTTAASGQENTGNAEATTAPTPTPSTPPTQRTQPSPKPSPVRYTPTRGGSSQTDEDNTTLLNSSACACSVDVSLCQGARTRPVRAFASGWLCFHNWPAVGTKSSPNALGPTGQEHQND